MIKINFGSINTIGIFIYVAMPDDRALATGIEIKLYWFEFIYLHIPLYSPTCWTRVSNWLWENLCSFEDHYRNIFYVNEAFERVLAKDYENFYLGSIPTIRIFLM